MRNGEKDIPERSFSKNMGVSKYNLNEVIKWFSYREMKGYSGFNYLTNFEKENNVCNSIIF